MTDATYDTVIYAVFAMDAYEHNADTGFWFKDLSQFFPTLVNNQLGSYVVSDVSTTEQQDDNDFFAVAYSDSDGTIISYRGTKALASDLTNGYGIGV